MSEYRIRLEDRYSSVFGMVARNVIPALGDLGAAKSVYGLLRSQVQVMDPENAPLEPRQNDYEPETYPVDPEDGGTNDLGYAIWDYLELEHPDLPEGGYRFAFPVMFTLSREPNLGITIVNQHAEGTLPPGEVVESYGWRPWRIRVRGLLVDMEDHQFPVALMGEVARATSLPDTYKVTNRVLNELAIYDVYVSAAVEFIPARDFKDTCEFIITLSSHEPVEALIINNR